MEQQWRKSSFSVREACLEVWRHQDVVMIRESEQPSNVIVTSPDNWDKFLKGVKAGEFDTV